MLKKYYFLAIIAFLIIIQALETEETEPDLFMLITVIRHGIRAPIFLSYPYQVNFT